MTSHYGHHHGMRKLPLLLALPLVLLFPGVASAHTATAPEVYCATTLDNFSNFPSGTHTVTFHITVNGVVTVRTGTFTGTSGTATVQISDLTAATGPLTISVYATWTDDGGGTSATTTVTQTCHEVPPTTTTTSPSVPSTTQPPAPLAAKFTG